MRWLVAIPDLSPESPIRGCCSAAEGENDGRISLTPLKNAR
jgi:hypothetical protein